MDTHEKVPQHAIGTKFIRNMSKRKDIETVVDILTTTNLSGDVVKIRYICSHDFLGQQVLDYDVNAVTIARGLINE